MGGRGREGASLTHSCFLCSLPFFVRTQRKYSRDAAVYRSIGSSNETILTVKLSICAIYEATHNPVGIESNRDRGGHDLNPVGRRSRN